MDKKNRFEPEVKSKYLIINLLNSKHEAFPPLKGVRGMNNDSESHPPTPFKGGDALARCK